MSTYRKKFDFWPARSKVATTEPEPAKSADNSSSAESPNQCANHPRLRSRRPGRIIRRTNTSTAKYANSKRKKPAQAILISCITHA